MNSSNSNTKISITNHLLVSFYGITLFSNVIIFFLADMDKRLRMTSGVAMLSLILTVIFVKKLLQNSPSSSQLNDKKNGGTSIGELAASSDNSNHQSLNLLEENSNEVFTRYSNNIQQINDLSLQLKSLMDKKAETIQNTTDYMQDMTQRINNQFLEIDSINGTATEMSEDINKVMESQHMVAKLASDTLESAQHGNTMIENSVNEIKFILNKIADTDVIILNLNEKILEINNITKSIDSIAGQTNLLALNAAIEAARAGESGRGFAVVADEVGKLAIESKKATEEISSLIKEIQNNSQEAVNSMGHSKELIEKSIDSIQNTRDTFNTIVEDNQKVKTQLNDSNDLVQKACISSEKVSETGYSLVMIADETLSSTHKVSKLIKQQNADDKDMSDLTANLISSSEELKMILNTL
ncbi:methyl-accepting chemotaxis sensory transducer with Pas/Pac sensor [Natronincola peptidivorans]|uniref:Methyl-accepting chemotaxis sensory transducer with Pas/Pac sensor n=1 Tax=Natronincola peptidivorans TaxID=426128 RepID=A0A1I0DPW6_9FIRM|nr:methyl-accepting chemotaxis protein [Natronincola peptidivorans]SET34281.1 methyl-accepting chemotaxis sensory transducer with Pas/Pac sensor [Natronincola peptidivorans]